MQTWTSSLGHTGMFKGSAIVRGSFLSLMGKRNLKILMDIFWSSTKVHTLWWMMKLRQTAWSRCFQQIKLSWDYTRSWRTSDILASYQCKTSMRYQVSLDLSSPGLMAAWVLGWSLVKLQKWSSLAWGAGGPLQNSVKLSCMLADASTL